jgi:putative hydrolase
VADDEDRGDDREFEDMLQQLFGGSFDPSSLDPEQLEELKRMGVDPAMMQAAMRQLQETMRNAGEDGIDWDAAKRAALHLANQSDLSISSTQRGGFDQAFTLATLWLSESTTISELASAPETITRGAWVEATMPVWQELAEPVATSIADALTKAIGEQAPEEMRGMLQGANRIMRTIGGSLFAGQLGHVVGELSKEVLSGGDVGIPVMPGGRAVILPLNAAEFGRDLEIPQDQLDLYLTTRELAHARLFRHAKWLRLHVIAQVTDFARGVEIDMGAIEDMASRFDPNEPDEFREAIQNGALLPERTEAQKAALARLENLLATIEGWVEVVTADATARIPSSDRIAEVVRRRRAVGGPGEHALGTLVGLELRPRRIREAAAMWRAVTDAVGVSARDSLWDYADLMPTAADIDDPAALIARIQAHQGGEPLRDEMDDAIEALLREAAGDGGSGAAKPDAEKSESEKPDDERDAPDGPTPV